MRDHAAASAVIIYLHHGDISICIILCGSRILCLLLGFDLGLATANTEQARRYTGFGAPFAPRCGIRRDNVALEEVTSNIGHKTTC